MYQVNKAAFLQVSVRFAEVQVYTFVVGVGCTQAKFRWYCSLRPNAIFVACAACSGFIKGRAQGKLTGCNNDLTS